MDALVILCSHILFYFYRCKPVRTEVHGVVRGLTGPEGWIPVLCCVLTCALACALLWVGGSVEG